MLNIGYYVITNNIVLENAHQIQSSRICYLAYRDFHTSTNKATGRAPEDVTEPEKNYLSTNLM